MKHYSVKFTNTVTNKKEIREYPVAHFDNYKGFLDFLNTRTFLLPEEGWIILDKIQEFDPVESKMKMADAFGKLIYNLR